MSVARRAAPSRILPRLVDGPTLYQYNDLPHDGSIRYFLLWPSMPTLTISLVTANINSLPQFAALSYAWGPPTRTNIIAVVDPITKESLGVLLVTANLRDALLSIPVCNEPVTLWADAICINQDNGPERNHQVKQMAKIYKSAKEVFVWLGHDEHNLGKDAFAIARLLVMEHGSQPYPKDLQLDSDESTIFHEETRLIRMKWLTERDWFRRIWTMQEIGLATNATMTCGSRSISWDVLSEAYCIIQRKVHHESLLALRFRPWIVTFLSEWKESKNLSFLEALDAARSRSTANPRDRIYAMLTHPSAQRKPDVEGAHESYIVQPDYSQTVQEVYTDTAIQIILATQSLDPLSYVRTDQLYFHQLTSKGRLALPSWVPDWREGRNTMQCIISISDFKACGPRGCFLNNRSPEFVRIDGHCYLETIAVRCGTVVKWCILDLSPGQKSYHEVQKAWYEIAADGQEQPDANLVHTFGRVLCGGLIHPHQDDNIDASGEFDTKLTSFWRSVWQAQPTSDVVASAEADPAVEYVWNQIQHACCGRKLFVTDTGYLGLGPSGLKKNDSVFILHSGRVPFVLRRIGFKVPRYFLVGECYVDGWMFGEASQSERMLEKVMIW